VRTMDDSEVTLRRAPAETRECSGTIARWEPSCEIKRDLADLR
jgi:hypothetical protein